MTSAGAVLVALDETKQHAVGATERRRGRRQGTEATTLGSTANAAPYPTRLARMMSTLAHRATRTPANGSPGECARRQPRHWDHGSLELSRSTHRREKLLAAVS